MEAKEGFEGAKLTIQRKDAKIEELERILQLNQRKLQSIQ